MANRNRLSPATFIGANRWRVTPLDVADGLQNVTNGSRSTPEPKRKNI
jgi:hypothetical protein